MVMPYDHIHLDEETVFAGAARIGHGPLVDDLCPSRHHDGVIPLEGVQVKAHPVLAILAKWFDIPGMQGRTAGAGIDFRLDAVDTEIGQGHPFTPADKFPV